MTLAPPRAWLPALAVLLLVSSALAPHLRAAAGSGEQASYWYYPNCEVTQRVEPTQWFDVSPGMTLTQPLVPFQNLAACSLSMKRPTHYAEMFRCSLLPWDPTALLPDAGAVALRTQNFQASALPITAQQVYWVPYPPLIVKVAPGVAEMPLRGVALQFTHIGYDEVFHLGRQPDGPAVIPGALQGTIGGAEAPMPGVHPVLGHALCSGDVDLQSYYVMQAVTSTDSLLDAQTEDVYQRFRLSNPTSLRWVEVAASPVSYFDGWTPGFVAIYDAQGQTSPPAVSGEPLVQTPLYLLPGSPSSWVAQGDPVTYPVLQANHDYWLRVRAARSLRLYTHQLTGTEGASFTSGIGYMFRRTVPGDPLLVVLDLALDFKIIGTSPAPWAVDVPSGAPGRGLHLAASPNPATHATMLAWSGATGRVRLEVLDVRGRRVASRESDESESGSWMWRAASDAGRPLPAGVYFVRAWDAGGNEARARVVLTR